MRFLKSKAAAAEATRLIKRIDSGVDIEVLMLHPKKSRTLGAWGLLGAGLTSVGERRSYVKMKAIRSAGKRVLETVRDRYASSALKEERIASCYARLALAVWYCTAKRQENELQSIAKKCVKDAPFVAMRALGDLARFYLKLGRFDRARGVFRRIVSEFSAYSGWSLYEMAVHTVGAVGR